LRSDSIYDVVADLVEFTDEEGYGKYLDLHECYVKFINLKGIEVYIADNYNNNNNNSGQKRLTAELNSLTLLVLHYVR